MTEPIELKAEILRLTREYSKLVHGANRPGYEDGQPESGNLSCPYAGRVFTEDEVEAAVSSTLDFWLTLGPEGEAFQNELAEYLGVKNCVLTNSGSSANLLAVSALTSYKIPDRKRLKPGDEVITCAAGFPTTVAPIIQCGLVPVFLDNDPFTGNAKLDLLEEAYVPGKTKAVMMAHTLGNPFDLASVCAFCNKHDLWLIEDNCDALGCTYTLPVELAEKIGLDHLLDIAEAGTHLLIKITEGKTSNSKLLTAPTGTFGDISTQSFYPPHHLTLGEGGSVNIVKQTALKILVESFRDWGRDCWCASGKDDTCGKRFQWKLGDLPEGYDHKYIYSHFGYNIKPLDPQAAIGRQQLKKLPDFVEARKRNWEFLRRCLAELEDVFSFSLPTHAEGWNETDGFKWDESGNQVDCSWFGFMLRIKRSAPFSRQEFAEYLEEKKIGNRMLFGGNLLRQPLFVQLDKDRPGSYRIAGVPEGIDRKLATSKLTGADRIMRESIFIGVYPGLCESQLQYMVDRIKEFVALKNER